MKPTVGDTNERLTIIAILDNNRVEVRCSCGVIKSIASSNFKRTRSCGCYAREVACRANMKHGMHGTPVYRCWKNMRARCQYPSVKAYRDYGGRGISVCNRWHIFENFLTDMGVPLIGMEIDRIDYNGNYEPSNCRWASIQDNANNKRNNRRFTVNGQSLTIAQLSTIFNINYMCLYKRLIVREWPIERALEAIPEIAAELERQKK